MSKKTTYKPTKPLPPPTKKVKPQEFQRKKFATDHPAAQVWVNDIIWKILAGPKPDTVAPIPLLDPPEAKLLCHEVILHNQLQGMAAVVFKDGLKEILSEEFYASVEDDRNRTEVFLNEIKWMLGPQYGAKLITIWSNAMRPFYNQWGKDLQNPRFVRTLTLWVPSLDIREAVCKLLDEGGYTYMGEDQTGYVYTKVTLGVVHKLQVRGMLWEGGKNWSSDVEHAIFDRARLASSTGVLQPDATDLFLLSCRHFAIDHLLGSGIDLFDMAQLLEHLGDGIDWVLIRQIKSMFAKPDWFWAAMISLHIFERKTGRTFLFPDWVRDGIKAHQDSFWVSFAESRLLWSSPDTRLSEFPRAYVKLSKGT